MDGARPRQRAGVTLRRKSDRVTLRDADGTTLCALNDSAAAVWELCDGATSPTEMISAVCELCGVPLEDARQQVGQSLSDLQRVGAIEHTE
jgi:hypothetical protein